MERKTQPDEPPKFEHQSLNMATYSMSFECHRRFPDFVNSLPRKSSYRSKKARLVERIKNSDKINEKNNFLEMIFVVKQNFLIYANFIKRSFRIQI